MPQDEFVIRPEPAPPASPDRRHGHKRVWSQLLANNVRYFRQRKNITQEALAEQCGIYRTYMSRIETGRCNPSLTVMVALAVALDVQPYALLVPID